MSKKDVTFVRVEEMIELLSEYNPKARIYMLDDNAKRDRHFGLAQVGLGSKMEVKELALMFEPEGVLEDA